MKKLIIIFLFFIFLGAVIVSVPFIVKQETGQDVVKSMAESLTAKGKADKNKEGKANTPMSVVGQVGGSLQNLVSPGGLSEAHAKAENECTACHSPFDGTQQNSQCLFCHKDIDNDIKTSIGYHGATSEIKSQSCKTCHAEHKGRDNKLIVFDRTTFVHDQTGFKLTGAHANPAVTCEKCHLKGKAYRETPSNCYGCHEKDDYHKGQLGKKCEDCHKDSSWKDSHYDHDKTKFPLRGKHKEVACTLCHLNNQYKGAPLDCLSCHKINDVHADTKKMQCDRCHDTEGWHSKVSFDEKHSFDHNKETKFKLINGHAKAKCEDCHKALVFHTVENAKCSDCHQVDDVHHGHNGPKCEQCHNDTTWKKINFDHDRDTKFKLLGKHKNLTCDDCHKGDTDNKKLDMTCGSCHQKDDVHKGSLGKNCKDCHNEKGWINEVKFDHDLTGFPLVGLHTTTSCAACHLTRDFKSAGKYCLNCHEKDDFHKGTQGTNCMLCHTPNSWKIWKFDHNKTKYPLTGAHDGLACSRCHIEPSKTAKIAELSTTCWACHEKQNKHGTTYGSVYKQCEVCHVTTNFRIINQSKIKIFHHPPEDIKVGLSENCGSCHKKDDVHEGGYGKQCGQCHSVETWKDLSRLGQ